jgi:hypothetical protein
MHTGLTVRSTGGGTLASHSVRQSTATELAPAQTVTAAAGAAGTGANAGRTPVPEPSHTNEVILDPHSREVIYRSADVRSRRVVRQMPEVAARRLKAYTRYVTEHAHPHGPQADIEV